LKEIPMQIERERVRVREMRRATCALQEASLGG
jgi:hypothetical protein